MILEKFLENSPRPSKMVLLVQKEVADRILVRDGKNSVLSVSVAAFGSPKYVKTVPPGAFIPPPSVDSAILAVENINFGKFEENGMNPSDFFRIVKAGFAHKRKFVKSNLTRIISSENLSEIWQKLALDEKIRAEKMAVSTWFDIVRLSQDLR
jgi:16S rRNA (adenine1518-N6/adenine1519-N6)-dimethyltransferase